MIRNLNARRSANGFTLIELLVVTLILSILMAVAIPLYLSSVKDARVKTCRSNMQTVANAVQAQRAKSASATYFTGAVTAGALDDLPSPPLCPDAAQGAASSYSVAADPTNGFIVSCTINPTDHGTFTPGKDNK